MRYNKYLSHTFKILGSSIVIFLCIFSISWER